MDALIQWSFLQVTAYAYMLVGIHLLAGVVTGVPTHLTSDVRCSTPRNQCGGIIMGIGMALTEEALFDERSGRILNASLAEYHVPVQLDVPAGVPAQLAIDHRRPRVEHVLRTGARPPHLAVLAHPLVDDLIRTRKYRRGGRGRD